MEKIYHVNELMQYGTAIISFLIVMTFTLLIFFWFVQQSVDKSVQNVLQKNYTAAKRITWNWFWKKEYEFLRGLLHTSKQLPICSATIIFSFLLNWLLPAPIIGLCFFLQTVSGTPAMERRPMQVHGTIFKRHWKADASLVLLCQAA